MIRRYGAAFLGLATMGLATLGSAGCGTARPPAPAAKAPAEARWQDVFDTSPELMLVIRPTAVRSDRVYGPLLDRALERAREETRVVGGDRALEALSEADELLVGLRAAGPDGPGEMVLVARGVRADVDPARLLDDDGRPAWSPGPQGGVPELTSNHLEQGRTADASLFELPGRTWVIAVGPARDRAREAFAHPFGRPEPAFDPGAVALARIDGAALVRRFAALQDLGGLAAIGRHLRSLTVTLSPGREHTVAATFLYSDDDSAAAAQVTAERTVSALSRTDKPGLAWLGGAHLEHSLKTVTLTAPLPRQLVAALLNAGAAPVDVPPPAPPP